MNAPAKILPLFPEKKDIAQVLSGGRQRGLPRAFAVETPAPAVTFALKSLESYLEAYQKVHRDELSGMMTRALEQFADQALRQHADLRIQALETELGELRSQVAELRGFSLAADAARSVFDTELRELCQRLETEPEGPPPDFDYSEVFRALE